MDFVLISSDKLKVELTKPEMERLGILYQNMDYKDETTRRALTSLLKKGKLETSFNPHRAKLFIEVYPTESGGCVLYFTALRTAEHPTGKPVGVVPVVFEFESCNDLIEGAISSHRHYSQRIYKNSLYQLDGRYRLILYPLDYDDRLSVYHLSEFARVVGNGSILAAFCEEHGKLVIADDALEVLWAHFGDSGG